MTTPNSSQTAPFFDSLEAFERVDNDMELFFELIDIFFEDYGENLEQLTAAIESNDADALEKNAHAIKSALGNLGAMKAFYLAYDLENAGSKKDLDGTLEKLEELKLAVRGFEVEIENHR